MDDTKKSIKKSDKSAIYKTSKIVDVKKSMDNTKNSINRSDKNATHKTSKIVDVKKSMDNTKNSIKENNNKNNIRDDKMNYNELMEELLNDIELFDESADNESSITIDDYGIIHKINNSSSKKMENKIDTHNTFKNADV
jgi:hypothetical protein